MEPATLSALRAQFADRLQENAPLSGYTSMRVGGPADTLIVVNSMEELSSTVKKLWNMALPFIILGGGTNVLVGDRGLRGVAIINRARLVRFDNKSSPPSVRAESGATLNTIAQQAARLGLSGIEWASTIPGTLGGAVYGNAGAFDGDIAGNLRSIEILHREHGLESWPVKKMAYSYRSSLLKRETLPVVILAAKLELARSEINTIQARMKKLSAQRRSTQPPGASMGSVFKNPPGDFAGRLIEAAGLKGKRIGNAEISPIHSNFFINLGKASAKDIRELIELTRSTVLNKFGISLELEIGMIGEWSS